MYVRPHFQSCSHNYKVMKRCGLGLTFTKMVPHFSVVILMWTKGVYNLYFLIWWRLSTREYGSNNNNVVLLSSCEGRYDSSEATPSLHPHLSKGYLSHLCMRLHPQRDNTDSWDYYSSILHHPSKCRNLMGLLQAEGHGMLLELQVSFFLLHHVKGRDSIPFILSPSLFVFLCSMLAPFLYFLLATKVGLEKNTKRHEGEYVSCIWLDWRVAFCGKCVCVFV